MPAYTIPGPGAASGYTMSSSGGASGPDISDLGWITADVTDGTWTQSDPAGVLLASVAVAGDITRVNYNTVAVASGDNNFSSSNNFTGPRWYKALTAVDGTRITSDDTFTLSVEMVQITPAVQNEVEIGLGYCVDPTSTLTNTMQKAGGSIVYATPTQNPRLSGMLTAGRASNTSAPGQKINFVTTSASGTRQGAVGSIALNNVNVRVINGSSNVNQTMPASTDLFLVVLAGLHDNAVTFTAPVDTQAKLRYRLIKWEDPPL